MLDAVTLDQLRTFIAAADQGSFSGAGRKLRRAQSVVSKTLANLEVQFGVRLFDRARRRPVLTPQGQVLLAHARTVVGDVDLLKAQAKHLAGGLEAELAVVVEVMFPMATLTAAVTAFHAAFPLTPLRLYVEALGAVIQPVLDGRCTLGISGELALVPPQFSQEPLLQVPLVQVTSPRHPLASYGPPIPSSRTGKARPTRAHGSLHALEGKGIRGAVTANLAPGGSRRKTRIPACGTRVGRDARGTRPVRPRARNSGQDRRRRRATRRFCPVHARGLSH